MPNLVGILRPQWGEKEIAGALQTQLDRVRCGASTYVQYSYVCAGFGMALQDHGILQNGRQPASSADGKLHLLLDGEIYNGDELRLKFRLDHDSARLSDPELCLRLIERHGAEIAHEFNGLFAISFWDAGAKRLQLISDHLAARSLFMSDGTAHFSSAARSRPCARPTRGKRKSMRSRLSSSFAMARMFAAVHG
jgi:asparagine synthetase B (glutamine-hydrolysing)